MTNITLPPEWEKNKSSCKPNKKGYMPVMKTFDDVKRLQDEGAAKDIHARQYSLSTFILDADVLALDTLGEPYWARKSIIFDCTSYAESDAILNSHGINR